MAYERNDRRYERDDRSSGDYRSSGNYGGDPRDRGFFERAGDEVRSWFGDDDAERRRRMDERYDYRRDRAGDRDYRTGSSGGYARYEAGGYRSPDNPPSWARSNRDTGDRSSGGYRSYNSQYDEGRQFSSDDRQSDAYGFGGGYTSGDYGNSDQWRDREYQNAYGDRGNRSRSDYGYQGREQGRGGYGAENRYGDQNRGGSHEHAGYHDWRSRQIDSFDRDYDEYRRENQSRFETEFASWRQNRQTQRNSLQLVKEHQEVVGSDGTHVGTVDHVRSDYILLTKNDRDAGGHHHSIPSSWIASVDDKVKLSKTAEEAKRSWREADDRGGLFGQSGSGQDQTRTGSTTDRTTTSTSTTR